MQVRGPGFFSVRGSRVMLDIYNCSHKFSSHSHEFSLFPCPQNMFPKCPICFPKVLKGMGWLHAVVRVTIQAATRYFWDILPSPSFSGWRKSELWMNKYLKITNLNPKSTNYIIEKVHNNNIHNLVGLLWNMQCSLLNLETIRSSLTLSQPSSSY